MAGRPSSYTQEIADAICEQLMEGISLREICRQNDMPGLTTVHMWLLKHDAFREQYARAREVQADTHVDEMIDIADNARNDWMIRNGGDDAGWRENGDSANRAKLRIDTRKWISARMAPKKYGERITQEHTGKDGKDLKLNGPTIILTGAPPGTSSPSPVDGVTDKGD